MSGISASELAQEETLKTSVTRSDPENRLNAPFILYEPLPIIKKKSLGAGSILPIGAFATTLTTLSLSLMEWRGVTTTNVYIANFFFIAAFGLVVTAQWELAIGNGLAYSIYSAFGLFYAGYAAMITPSFGVADAYGDDIQQCNNAVGFFMILWTVFVFALLVAVIPTNLTFIVIFIFLVLGFLFVASSYFAAADGHATASVNLRKAGGVFCFLAGLGGWYLTFHRLTAESLLDIPLGDTSRYFGKKTK
ncbi:hypothetical protein INS49_009981 [Diaporthe citri]|uniref:uncharacterized protein n=1 Tax=Diaporthe citri TaxID=83186 RepID=UPI001C8228E7|nr:uncharacterized protein INS49_009981 [Diaporthe citri]KAG6361753.1 hypothetical protein INS49_009981 [Diaporthe citri]